MPRYIRSAVLGAAYFLTVALADRASDLLVREVDRLRRAYQVVSRGLPFETVAICILPDHLHAVWRLPEGDSRYGLRWQQIKRGFSRGLPSPPSRQSLRRKREKGIWQRRYWEHLIRDDDDLARHIDYIHFNPVKHGHVEHVRDWPYSSFHRWVAEGRLAASWGWAASPDSRRYGE